VKKPFVTIRKAEESDKNIWNTLVHHPLETWQWGEFRKSMGVDVVRLIEEKENKIVDAWQLTFHKVPISPYTIGYFP